jgi:hypothetical protein
MVRLDGVIGGFVCLVGFIGLLIFCLVLLVILVEYLVGFIG